MAGLPIQTIWVPNSQAISGHEQMATTNGMAECAMRRTTEGEARVPKLFYNPPVDQSAVSAFTPDAETCSVVQASSALAIGR